MMTGSISGWYDPGFRVSQFGDLGSVGNCSCHPLYGTFAGAELGVWQDVCYGSSCGVSSVSWREASDKATHLIDL